MTQRPDDLHPFRDAIWPPSRPGPEVARMSECFEALNAPQMRRDRAAERARIAAWFVIAIAAGVIAAALVLHLAAGAAAAVADPFANKPW